MLVSAKAHGPFIPTTSTATVTSAAAAKQSLQFFLSQKERMKPKHDFEKHQTLGRVAASSVGEEGFRVRILFKH